MANENQNQPIKRRRFLLGIWGTTIAAMLGETGVLLLKMAQPVRGEGTFGGVVQAGLVDEFEIGSVNYVRSGRFYLVRLEEGFLALWQTCTHLGCSVPWVEEAKQFHCPCHASIFTLNGEVVSGPAPRPLKIFPIEIVSGEIFVDTSKPIDRTSFDISQVKRV